MFREIFLPSSRMLYLNFPRKFFAHQKSTRSSRRFHFWRKTQRQNSTEKTIQEMEEKWKIFFALHFDIEHCLLYFCFIRGFGRGLGPHCGTHNLCVVRSSSPLSVRERMEKMQEVKASSIVEMFALCRCCCFYFRTRKHFIFFCLKEIFSFQHCPLLRDWAYHVRPAAMHCMWCNDRRSRSCVLSHWKRWKIPVCLSGRRRHRKCHFEVHLILIYLIFVVSTSLVCCLVVSSDRLEKAAAAAHGS